MHIGYFSSILGTKGGPAIVDKRVLEAISASDTSNQYTVYGLTESATQGLNINNPNIRIKTIRPSGKWAGIAFGLTWELKRRPVDLLHATIIAPPIIPCKFVTTITCWSQYSQPELYPPLIRMRLLYLINRAIKNASGIFCYTEFLKDKLLEKFDVEPERVFLVQPAIGSEMKAVEDEVKLKTYLEQLGIDCPFVLFIGSLTKRKNVPGLIRAFHILKNQLNSDHKLVLLGEKAYYFGEIENTISELGLEDQVIIVGRQKHEDLPYFYSGADVFVFPTFSEGFGLPPLEAMACGTPVVASNVTSVPEVVGDAAVLMDPHDHEAMAAGIYKCLTDTAFRNELIQKGKKRAGEFTWERAARQTISAYETVFHAQW